MKTMICMAMLLVGSASVTAWGHGDADKLAPMKRPPVTAPRAVDHHDTTGGAHIHESVPQGPAFKPAKAYLLHAPPLHPMLVHFPIVLLLAAAVFGILHMVQPTAARYRRLYRTLVAGTVGAVCALASGLYFEATVTHRHDGPIHDIMEWHESLGIAITILTGVLVLLGGVAMRRASPTVQRMVAWGAVASGLLVALTSHLGGLLVHEFGIAFGV
ncbi:MAG: hypothetical protein HYV02_07800 [Deltaproteobacteria bacterium]|nr:hypothetical protein [Deltaproteobacteria bacterium]